MVEEQDLGQDQEPELKDIGFRQGFIEKDSGSPLHLIREKEMEISGRVLSAKKEAEEIVSEARRKAAEIVNEAEEEGERLAAERAREVEKESEEEAERVLEKTDEDLAAMEKRVQGRKEAAADAVVEMVTDV